VYLIYYDNCRNKSRKGKIDRTRYTVKPLYIKDFVSSNKLVPNDFEEKQYFRRIYRLSTIIAKSISEW
jgi:hypothetical protein